MLVIVVKQIIFNLIKSETAGKVKVVHINIITSE